VGRQADNKTQKGSELPDEVIGDESASSRATPVAVGVAISPGPAVGRIDDAERSRRKDALEELMELMRPAVQADGGDLAVVDVDYDAGVVEVQLQGACGSCAISAVTLQGGVERLLKERLDWVTEVTGGVDESVDPFESASMGRGGYVPRF
jgi:Fe-S cluster biogenesis protein NfuA